MLTPEALPRSGGKSTSYSTGPSGVEHGVRARAAHGLARERRRDPMDSTRERADRAGRPAPSKRSGAHEVHRLLRTCAAAAGWCSRSRRRRDRAIRSGSDLRATDGCFSNYATRRARRRVVPRRTLLALPPEVNQIVWRRPPPGRSTALATSARRDQKAVDGRRRDFRSGSGRIAVVGGDGAVRQRSGRDCAAWGADVVVARAFEYVRRRAPSASAMVFDEFHHGFGMHGGSVTAIATISVRARVGTISVAGAACAAAARSCAARRDRSFRRMIPSASPAVRRSSTPTRSATHTPTCAPRAPRRRDWWAACAGARAASSRQIAGPNDRVFLEAVGAPVSVLTRAAGRRRSPRPSRSRSRRASSRGRRRDRTTSSAQITSPSTHQSLMSISQYRRRRASCVACATPSRRASSARTPRSRTCSSRSSRAATC